MQFRSEVKGVNQLKRKLRSLASKARALDGEHSIPLSELCPPEFMAKYTDFQTLEELFGASGFIVETPEDFAAIPDSEWDSFVASVTRFPDWRAMQEAAAAAWIKRRLGLN